MRGVIFVLVLIVLSCSAFAVFNDSYQAVCGNNATEMGEDCDPPGKKCYTPDFLEGKCTQDCMCMEYSGPACHNGFLETGEDCEMNSDCPAFHYCNNNCKCIAKVADYNVSESYKEVEENSSEEKSPENKSFEEIKEETDKKIKKKYYYENYTVNESFFEKEDFEGSAGIKITAAITNAVESVFSSIFDLVKRWLL